MLRRDHRALNALLPKGAKTIFRRDVVTLCYAAYNYATRGYEYNSSQITLQAMYTDLVVDYTTDTT